MALFLQQTSEDINIIARLYPRGDRRYLPANLQMNVLDESGNIVCYAISKSSEHDPYIQIEFNGLPGEEFSVTVDFSEQSIEEYFVI